MSIFTKREAFKPFEYPEVTAFKDAINHSYWLVSEWNFVSDVHDFKVGLDDAERGAIKNAMLAISQIEVSVKRFWTKLGDRFPKPEIEQVGVTFGECFVDGTEILTPTGWRDLKDVQVGDDVMQFNPDNTFTLTQVKHKTDQDYSGPMYRFHKRTTETVVTPNHRMVYFDHKGEYKEEKAEKWRLTNTNSFLPEAGRLVGGRRFELSYMDRLRIAIQADGNRRYYNSGYGRKLRKGGGKGAEYEVRVQKPRKVERLDWILKNIQGVEYTKRPIPSKPGMCCFTIRIDADYDYKTFDWVDLRDKTADWCEQFVQELAEWDGTRLPNKKDCKVKFSTTNKAVADRAQMIGIGAGYRTNLSARDDDRSETFSTTFIVSFTANRERVTLPPLKAEVFEYTGMVRCVTVESGAVITRLNGKTFISGNSEVRHADAYSHLLETLGLNSEFDQLMQNPVIQGRIDYLTKYLKGASDNSDENFTLTLTLFSIFIENVSLFSQFLVIKSFNKHRNVLKDVDNVVQATAKEEQIHCLFGVKLLEIIRREFPGWFNDDFYAKIRRACRKAYDAECKIVDWIFEAGELSFLSKNTVKEFIKNRFNDSLKMIGCGPVFDVDPAAVASLQWFEDEIHADVNTDFFHKKPVSYFKFGQSVRAGDLF